MCLRFMDSYDRYYVKIFICLPFSLQELVLPVCSTNLSDSSGIDEQVVKEKSIIFTKHVSDYQKAINAASFELCMTTPSLLLGKKGDLLELARRRFMKMGMSMKKDIPAQR